MKLRPCINARSSVTMHHGKRAVFIISQRDFQRTQREERDGPLWSGTDHCEESPLTCETKSPGPNTDEEIKCRQRRNAYRERCSGRSQADPRLCEIGRIFGRSALKPLSQNTGEQVDYRGNTAVPPNGVHHLHHPANTWVCFSLSSLI